MCIVRDRAWSVSHCTQSRTTVTAAWLSVVRYPQSTKNPGAKCDKPTTEHNIAMTFGLEKLEWCGYLTVKKIEDIFIRFDRIHKRDGQTDRRTDTARRLRPRLHSIARQK